MIQLFTVACAMALIAAERADEVRLVKVASLKTRGNAGFEAFTINNITMLATANFWDGKSADMSAASTVHALAPDSQGRLRRRTPALHTVTTQGAHGWDYFAGASGEHFLVVCNYYGCGSSRGPATEACRSTSVFTWADTEQQWVLAQSLATAGPAQTDHYVRNGKSHVVVGENFNDVVSVWRDDGSPGEPQFIRVHEIRTAGAGAMAIAEIGQRLLLVATSYHSGTQDGWRTRTGVHELLGSGDQERFQQVQEIATFGCHDADYAFVGGRHLLFLSEDRSDESSRITSGLLEYDVAAGRFIEVQRIPTDGAHAAELFEIDGTAYLAVANFGDRLGKRYASRSTLWREDEDEKKFVEVATVPTVGATDWEHFVLRSPDTDEATHYLAVANEGDIQNRKDQTSHVYRVEVGVSPDGLRSEL